MDARVEQASGQRRGRIGPDDVKAAIAAARNAQRGDDKIHDLNDVDQPYLTLRRRGGAVKWIVRGYRQTRTIGAADGIHADPSYLTIPAARKTAAAVYAQLGAGKPKGRAPAKPTAPAWTWSDLDAAYQAMLAKPRWIDNRMKPSSPGTCSDVRLAFAKPSFNSLHGSSLTALDRPALIVARDGIASFRQRQKSVTYFKAAMTWAADEHPDESGLAEGMDRWWERLTAGPPSAEQMHAIETRRRTHRARKAALKVEHIGELLARHEAYCAGRSAEDKISPGVRWGLWWVCYTANRRFSTVKLRRAEFHAQDPLGETGWGRAEWPADTMKAKIPFWLPLPKAVVEVAAGSVADYTQLVANHHGEWPSAWVFASTRRYGRDPDNDDVSVYPNSLNRHIARMREDDVLEGLPYFSLHLVRSAMGDYISQKVSGVTSSLVLSHTVPSEGDEASETTREYYLTSQRMAEKAAGMRVWSEALIEAFLKAGGTMPAPSEGPRVGRGRKQD